jgi:hypothetical protein
MEKILITGTGRCGTTFLIKLFTFLNFNTGFTKDNYNENIFKNCNSGMERTYDENYYILKNPKFILNIEHILKDTSVKIKKVIIPIRNFKQSAMSRVKHGNNPGGLWNSANETTQIKFYKHIMSNYLYFMVKYDIETIFIDFDKMINDKQYLFNKLKSILDEKNIEFSIFSQIYDEVTTTSKP